MTRIWAEKDHARVNAATQREIKTKREAGRRERREERFHLRRNDAASETAQRCEANLWRIGSSWGHPCQSSCGYSVLQYWLRGNEDSSLTVIHQRRLTLGCTRRVANKTLQAKRPKCENYQKMCQSFYKTGQNLWMQCARQRGICLWFPAHAPKLVPMIIFLLNRFQSCNSLKGDKNLQGQIGLA